MYLYLGFIALLLECVHVSKPLFFMFCICLWEGTSLLENSVCSVKCSAIWVILLVFHNSSPTVAIAETNVKCMLAYPPFVKVYGILTSPPYCNITRPLAETVYEHELIQVTAALAHFTGMELDNDVEMS